MRLGVYWSGTTDRTNYRPDLAAVLADTRFHIGETIAVEGSHELSARDLAYRILTLSGSSPAALGDKVNTMLHDVERRLLPFSRAGSSRRSSLRMRTLRSRLHSNAGRRARWRFDSCRQYPAELNV